MHIPLVEVIIWMMNLRVLPICQTGSSNRGTISYTVFFRLILVQLTASQCMCAEASLCEMTLLLLYDGKVETRGGWKGSKQT